MWTEQDALAVGNGYKINKDNINETKNFEYNDKEEIANLLILYLEQNDLYDDIRKKIYVQDLVTKWQKNYHSVTGEYIVDVKRSINIEGSNYFRSVERTDYCPAPPENKILYDGMIDALYFETLLKSDKDFLLAVIQACHLTPLGLKQNASFIIDKERIRKLDYKIAYLEYQIDDTNAKLKTQQETLKELKRSREKLMSAVKKVDDIKEKRGMSY